jgi:PIN domain nuclease of toxin-antitoxin system
MSFLLDTHILLWFLENDSKLSNQVRELTLPTDESGGFFFQRVHLLT